MKSLIKKKIDSKKKCFVVDIWSVMLVQFLLTLASCAVLGPIDSSIFVTPWTVCSPPGSSVYGMLQARILEWAAISFSRGSSQSRD